MENILILLVFIFFGFLILFELACFIKDRKMMRLHEEGKISLEELARYKDGF